MLCSLSSQSCDVSRSDGHSRVENTCVLIDGVPLKNTVVVCHLSARDRGVVNLHGVGVARVDFSVPREHVLGRLVSVVVVLVDLTPILYV